MSFHSQDSQDEYGFKDCEAMRHEKEAIELLRSQIPPLPNPYFDWLKLAAKNATNDSQIAAAAKAVLEIAKVRREAGL